MDAFTNSAIIGVITAVDDLILRYVSVNLNIFPILQPYFAKHSIIAAMVWAGLIGAITVYPLLMFSKPVSTARFTTATFVISAISGVLINKSRILPVLSDTYYAQCPLNTLALDGFSGIIVLMQFLYLQPYLTT